MKEYFIIFLRLGGLEFLIFFLLPILLYFLANIFLIYFLKEKKKDKFLVSFLRFFVVMAIFFASYGIILFILSKINGQAPERIIQASDMCARWDKSIFGVDLPFWMQGKDNYLKEVFSFFSSAMVYSYNILMFIFSIVLFLSLVKSFSIFKRFLFAFVVIVAISLPVWYFIPAYTPLDMYLDNRLAHSPSPEIQKSLDNYQPNENLKFFFEELKKVQKDKSMGVSTFPSMHVGWSVIILYFCLEIWPPLLLLMIPYVMINGVSTVFTLQHYGIDVIAGVIAAIVAIYLSKLIKPSDDSKEISSMLRKDFLSFRDFLKEALAEIRKIYKRIRKK